MKPLTLDAFNSWLEMYSKASKENDPQASTDLFSPEAKYYETPFNEPLIGSDAIYHYWSYGAQNFKDKESNHEIFSVKDDLGVARWRSQFTNINTGRRLLLDCIFLVRFDDDGKCSEFREWWHLQELDNVNKRASV